LCSSMLRFSSGILTTAMASPCPLPDYPLSITNFPASSDRLEQEFENLDVPVRVSQRLPPGIQAVAMQQERVRRGIAVERAAHFRREPRHVLIVRDDRDPLAVL